MDMNVWIVTLVINGVVLLVRKTVRSIGGIIRMDKWNEETDNLFMCPRCNKIRSTRSNVPCRDCMTDELKFIHKHYAGEL